MSPLNHKNKSYKVIAVMGEPPYSTLLVQTVSTKGRICVSWKKEWSLKDSVLGQGCLCIVVQAFGIWNIPVSGRNP